MEGHFLACGGENTKVRQEMNRGQDLPMKALKYLGYITPANIRMVGICPDCGKSFCFHAYSLYMGQCDVAYSDDGLECCSISSQEIDKDSWTHQTDGKTFHYYNSFCCPHCGTPYIDYQKFPEKKKFGVSGCVYLGRELYYDTPKKLKQESDTAKDQKIADEREEMKKIYNDSINGEGRLPEGFAEKYNRTVQGYILHETPFKKYLYADWWLEDSTTGANIG